MYTQYEVWVQTEDQGPDELILTTGSLKEAKEVCRKNYPAYILYEDDDGELREVD